MAKITPEPKTLHLLGSTVRYWTFHPEQTRTIVMVHGFRGNHRGLLPFVRELPLYRIILPDLPGFGDSTPMRDQPHTVAGYTTFLAAFLRALKLEAPPVLLGHSFGSVVAARLAATAPRLISNELLLISPIFDSPLKRIDLRYIGAKAGEAEYWLGHRLPPKLGGKLVESRALNRAMSLLLMTTHDRQLRKSIYKHHLSNLESPQYRTVFYQAFRSVNRDGVLEYTPRIAKHTLLVAGDKDTVSAIRANQSTVSKLRHGRLVLIPDVGHLTHLETPAIVGKAIRDFLRAPRP